MKNPLPAKPHVVMAESGMPVSEPTQMAGLLNQYWGKLESWPSQSAKQHAEFVLEDKYSAFLPRCCREVVLSLEDVIYQRKIMRNSAAGMDGWTVQEIKALPRQALSDLFDIWPSILSSLSASPLSLFKRVPLEKGDHDIPQAQHLRPIDVFPVITRLFTSAWTRKAPCFGRVKSLTPHKTPPLEEFCVRQQDFVCRWRLHCMPQHQDGQSRWISPSSSTLCQSQS